jgi:transcription elongation factor Elf1
MKETKATRYSHCPACNMRNVAAEILRIYQGSTLIDEQITCGICGALLSSFTLNEHDGILVETTHRLAGGKEVE